MKNSPTDPILAEVHAIKDAISAEFHHDVTALCRYLMRENKSTVIGLKLNQPDRLRKRPRRCASPPRRKVSVKAA
jgi:hypothetical protein